MHLPCYGYRPYRIYILTGSLLVVTYLILPLCVSHTVYRVHARLFLVLRVQRTSVLFGAVEEQSGRCMGLDEAT